MNLKLLTALSLATLLMVGCASQPGTYDSADYADYTEQHGIWWR